MQFVIHCPLSDDLLIFQQAMNYILIVLHVSKMHLAFVSHKTRIVVAITLVRCHKNALHLPLEKARVHELLV